MTAKVLRQGGQQLVARRSVQHFSRSLQRQAERLPFPGQPAWRSRGRPVQGRGPGAVAMERHLASGRNARRRRLGGRDADSVQDDLVQSGDRHLGPQSQPPRRAQQRDDGLGVEKPDAEPGDLGRAHGDYGPAAGFGLGYRAVVDGRRAARASRRATIRSDTEPSLDVFYKITPSLNAALTLNTDFSATEVDDRQVNLTRFGLFFPEQRDFFLQDADIYEFGRIGQRSMDSPFARPLEENALPFFSRRIGLSATGQPVDLEGGGKLSGRVGPLDDRHARDPARRVRERRARGPVRGPRRRQRVGRVRRRPHRHRWRSALESRQQRRRRRLPLPEHAFAEWPHARVRGLVSAELDRRARGRRRRVGRPALGAEHGRVQGRCRHQGSRKRTSIRHWVSSTARDIRDYTGELGYTYRPFGTQLARRSTRAPTSSTSSISTAGCKARCRSCASSSRTRPLTS